MKTTAWLNVGSFQEIEFLFLFSEIYIFKEAEKQRR